MGSLPRALSAGEAAGLGQVLRPGEGPGNSTADLACPRLLVWPKLLLRPGPPQGPGRADVSLGLGQRAAPRGHVHMCCGLLVVTCDPTRVSRRRARGVCRCQAEACPPQGPSRWAKSCRPSPRPGVLASVPPFLSACGTLPQTKRGSKRCGTQHPAHTPRSCLQPSWPSFICTWHRRGGERMRLRPAPPWGDRGLGPGRAADPRQGHSAQPPCPLHRPPKETGGGREC